MIKECKYECDYKATNKGNLKTHPDSLQNGVRNKCKECEYQAIEKSRIKTHQDYSQGGGMKIYAMAVITSPFRKLILSPCKEYDYEANETGSLKSHQDLVHRP